MELGIIMTESVWGRRSRRRVITEWEGVSYSSAEDCIEPAVLETGRMAKQDVHELIERKFYRLSAMR